MPWPQVSDVLAALHDRRNGSEKRVVVLEDCCSAVAGEKSA